MLKDSSVISYFTKREDGNMSFSREPSREVVCENFRKVAEKLNIEYEAMVTDQQTHGITVGIVTGEHLGSGISKPLAFAETDALLTNVPGIALCTIHADCIPIQLFDPVQKVVGTVHSGWKGTLNQIVAHTVDKMKEHYQSNPKDILVAIGPGICQRHFEVGTDVQTLFSEMFPLLCQQEEFIRPASTSGKWLLNLKAFIEESLAASGVPKENIQISKECTYCLEDRYFSYRREGKKPIPQGAMASIIMLKEKSKEE